MNENNEAPTFDTKTPATTTKPLQANNLCFQSLVQVLFL